MIVDYCVGNLRSIQKALETLDADVFISSQEEDLKKADALILPGVGAFRDAVKNIMALKPALFQQIESGKSILGICLGLQLLFTESTEGGIHEGLNVFQGQILRLPESVKVPHMGWNTLKIIDSSHHLVEGLTTEEYVYFAHSYYGKIDDKRTVVALTEYGVEFPSILAKKNVLATQFHPEKSGKTGLMLLKNFLNYVKR